MRRLTATELLSIANDLRTAAGVYSTDAWIADRDNVPRVAEQFRRQSKASLQLAELIEQGEIE